MVPIIQSLLDAENQAEQIIAVARERVQQERSEWEREEQTRLREATLAAENRVQAELESARADAQTRRDQATRRLSVLADEYAAQNREAIERAIEDVVREICRPELESG